MNTVTNTKIYNDLNSKTKEYLTLVFSWMDYLSNNRFKIFLKDGNGEKFDTDIDVKSDIYALSFFLAGISSIDEIKEVFEKNDISIDSITTFCNGNGFNTYESATEAESFNDYDLNYLLEEISSRMSSEYNIDKDKIDMLTIMPWQLFDYYMVTSKEIIEDLLDSELDVSELEDTEVMSDYNELMNEYEDELANIYGVNNESKDVVYEIDGYVFEFLEEGLTISFKDESPFKEINIVNAKENTTTKIWNGSKIYKINNKEATKEVLEEFVNTLEHAAFCRFELWNPEKGSIETFTCYKEEMFTSKKEKTRPTSFLEKIGRDITNQPFIKNPAVGREKELDEIETVLLYPEKDRSIIITGGGGVGKSALVKGLCYRIQNRTINPKLLGLRIIDIDVTNCTANTKYVGELEKKLLAIFEEASKDKNIIICIEEIHRVMGAGKTDGDDNSIAQILKSKLDGDIRVIGTTTEEEYSEYIEPDTAFKSRFERINISEPNEDVLYSIINDLIISYNKLSNEGVPTIDLSEEDKRILITKLIEATRKNHRHYQDSENNPRLLVNVIKRAYAVASKENSSHVTLDHILHAFNSNQRIYDDVKGRYTGIIKSSIESNKPKRENNVLEFKRRIK